MQIAVALGLSFHFLALASGQFFAELASAVRRFKRNMPIGARD